MKKTGGGPALPPLTESENLLADAMDGRPLMHGIDGGIDTDGELSSSFIS
ncbi:hypothetical protein FSP39_020604 [Pinctada imbricata]|uniref:Uncharacterized protein n=1 Tax=Pinctada imbricata TaxID=66713 RepID=A0AA88Y088_PINIB|nr:hypothetical protein FSP39_020604 [Pinctada imbricata]